MDTMDIMSILSVAIILVTAIIIQGITIIPQDPPHVALVTYWGQYNGQVKKPGWRFFLLRGLIYDFTLIDIRDIDDDLPPQEIIVPDNATIKINAQVTFAPAYDLTTEERRFYQTTPGTLLKNYMYKGGKKGVLGIFMGTYQARVREYFQKDDEGPSTWEEAIQSGDIAVLAMMRAINGESILGTQTNALKKLERNLGVPMTSLYKYFMNKKQNIREEKLFGPNWKKLEESLKSMVDKAQYNALIKAFSELDNNLQKIRQGEGSVIIPDLGIRVKRLAFPDIKPVGKTAVVAEKKAVEKLERGAEKLELAHVAEQIDELANVFEDKGWEPKAAVAAAKEIVQTERGKITKDVREFVLTMDPETRSAIAAIAPHVDKLLGLRKKGGQS